MLRFIFLFLFLHFSESSPFTLTEDNWESMLKNEWLVQFYAPWCPACKSLQPVWHEFAEWGKDLDVSVGSVDITVCPGLSGRFMITALPSIYHVKNGVFRQYRGPRDRESLISYIEERKWSQTETVAGWRAPDSAQMTVVSHFFRFSMVLRNLHQILTEQNGVPVWLSYVLFVAATVLVGSLLGLFIVCCVDTFCGSRAPSAVAPVSLNKATLHSSASTSDQESEVVDQPESERSEADDNVIESEDDGAISDIDPSGTSNQTTDTQSPPRDTAVRKRRARKVD